MTRCKKLRYSTKARATAALAVIILQGKRDPSHQETRAYECPRCHGWHLTSLAAPATRTEGKCGPGVVCDHDQHYFDGRPA